MMFGLILMRDDLVTADIDENFLHPFERDHTCLGCQYKCACRFVTKLTCDTCGKTFPPRLYNGHDLAYCSAECDPQPVNWTGSVFVQHVFVTGCCDAADYMHVQEPFLIDRTEGARLGLGVKPHLVRHVDPRKAGRH